ncbi:hypothetical protein BT96DRAFT_994609 [Gymnopus androsaceus JB14]|uniref:Uncharacterized protein n=1 Tax=Gymnopus androsaceus JB14 TaxID=1447944 RepID=A0A6A4HIN9_9AGAR|nr:hypothetical protein BT96DRAFT_994609 [Gymnopus androsaceus JB14]
MSRIQAFWGNREGGIGAEKFLEAIDTVVAIRDNDWDRVAEFESKLGGTAYDWFNAVPKSLRSVWSILHKLFIVYFIECIGNNAFCSKCLKMLSTPSFVTLITEVSNQSTSSPIYHVLVEEINDPVEVFQVALQELQSSADTERAFRILWDAARQIGSNNCTCGNEFNLGFGMGKSAGIEEGKKLGLEQVAKERHSMASVAVDTSDLPKTQIVTSTDTSDLTPAIPEDSPLLSGPNNHTPATTSTSWVDDSDSLPAVTLVPPPIPAACNDELDLC